jgi:hypothetical protein
VDVPKLYSKVSAETDPGHERGGGNLKFGGTHTIKKAALPRKSLRPPHPFLPQLAFPTLLPERVLCLYARLDQFDPIETQFADACLGLTP